MVAEELRIGNWVKYYGLKAHPSQVTSITEDEFWSGGYKVSDVTGNTAIDALEPIPITEQWLLEFGAREINHEWNIGNLWIAYNKRFRCWNLHLIDQPLKPIEYIHQLQNLYYALTGEELIRKT